MANAVYVYCEVLAAVISCKICAPARRAVSASLERCTWWMFHISRRSHTASRGRARRELARLGCARDNARHACFVDTAVRIEAVGRASPSRLKLCGKYATRSPPSCSKRPTSSQLQHGGTSVLGITTAGDALAAGDGRPSSFGPCPTEERATCCRLASANATHALSIS